MLEDLFCHLLVLYESDDTHCPLTFDAGERIYLIDFLYQSFEPPNYVGSRESAHRSGTLQRKRSLAPGKS
jgi:hypothetical protein